MCNMHSQTATRDTVGKLFKVGHNRLASFEPLPGIYPANNVPIIRNAADGDRECLISNWGFVLNLKGQAPKRVTNFRDDKLSSRFWSSSYIERRCLVPVTSFAEPKGKRPAAWHWFALSDDRPLFAFAGIWRTHKGQLKKDGKTLEVDVHSFMTTAPNGLVATIHPKRMPVMLTTDADFDCWLNGTPDEARGLAKSFPANKMKIVQAGVERKDLSASK